MAGSFSNAAGSSIMIGLVKIIQDNKAYLSEIDGAIGDGDHGINMNKGFTMFAEQVNVPETTLADGMRQLGRILLTEIGGSMGPIYGTLFREMAKVIKDKPEIDGDLFGQMLDAAKTGVQSLGDAQVGDKTLMDTLIPATEAFHKSFAAKKDFAASLVDMEAAAKMGWESTKDLVAKKGRSSRLGERSRGVLDAGATSCYLILKTFAETGCKLLSAS